MVVRWANWAVGWSLLLHVCGGSTEDLHSSVIVETSPPQRLVVGGNDKAAPCPEPYVKLSRNLRFNASVVAAIPPEASPIGNGFEMQCWGSDLCFVDPPNNATCTLLGVFGGRMRWNCQAKLFSSQVAMTAIKVTCQDFYGDKFCVYRDSCVLSYSLARHPLIYGYVIAVSLATGIALCAIITCCGRLRQRVQTRPIHRNASITTVAGSITYDRPPPYEPQSLPRSAHSPAYPSRGSSLQLEPSRSVYAAIPEPDEAPPPYSEIAHVDFDGK